MTTTPESTQLNRIVRLLLGTGCAHRSTVPKALANTDCSVRARFAIWLENHIVPRVRQASVLRLRHFLLDSIPAHGALARFDVTRALDVLWRPQQG